MQTFNNRKRSSENEDFDFPDFMGNKKVFTTRNSFNTNCYEIFLDEEIGDPAYYRPALEILGVAGPEDYVKLHIDTTGGQLDTAIKLINAIQDCEANVVGVLESKAYSAGSLILLSCPSIAIKPYSTFMAHSGMSGAWGPFSKAGQQLQFFAEETERLMRNVYEGFLSEEEIEDVVKGHREIWLKDAQIMERLEAFSEYKRAKHEEAVAQMQQQLEEETLPVPRKTKKKVAQKSETDV